MGTTITYKYNPNDNIVREKNLGFTSYTARERKNEPQTQNNFAFQFLFDKGQVAYIAAAANAGMSQISGAEAISTNYKEGLRQINETLNCSLQNFSAPSKSIQQIVIDFFNSQIKYAGKPTYGTANITLNTFIGLGSKNILAAWSDLVQNSRTLAGGWARSITGYEPPPRNNRNLDEYLNELYPNIGYKVDGVLLECARDGTIVNQWDYIGMWLSTFTSGTYNMSGSTTPSQATGVITVDMIRQSEISYVKSNYSEMGR